MLGMKNHFISGSIEIREVDIAGVACTCFSSFPPNLTFKQTNTSLHQQQILKCHLHKKKLAIKSLEKYEVSPQLLVMLNLCTMDDTLLQPCNLASHQ